MQYQDLGLTLKATPTIESETDVDLAIEIDLSSLAGSSINQLPILIHRQYSGAIAVHSGKCALLASVISRQDSSVITGFPGLTDLAGQAGATNRQDDRSLAELVILVTPHIVRLAHPNATSAVVFVP